MGSDASGQYSILAQAGTAKDNHLAVVGEVKTTRVAAVRTVRQARPRNVVHVGERAVAVYSENLRTLVVRSRHYQSLAVRCEAQRREIVSADRRSVIGDVSECAVRRDRPGGNLQQAAVTAGQQFAVRRNRNAAAFTVGAEHSGNAGAAAQSKRAAFEPADGVRIGVGDEHAMAVRCNRGTEIGEVASAQACAAGLKLL